MRKDLADRLDETTRREALNDIASESLRLQNIIDNLLFLARAERYNGALNAVIAWQVETARERARAADAAAAKGEFWGPLHGVPMTIKESFDVAGFPTTWGDPAFKDHRATTNSLLAQRMIDAGATLFGKTNVPLNLADAVPSEAEVAIAEHAMRFFHDGCTVQTGIGGIPNQIAARLAVLAAAWGVRTELRAALADGTLEVLASDHAPHCDYEKEVEFDYAPFQQAAQLLYAGPWVAERTAAVGKFIEGAGSDAKVWPTTRDIILGGRKYSAVDAFEGQYRLKSLKERAAIEMRDLDFLALPTAGSIYTKADLEREPVLCNSNLGHYTNFVNFFGLSGLALPFGFRPDGMPFGITLIARADAERALLAFGAAWQRAVKACSSQA